MSVVIIGGNERMERQYMQICKTYGYKAAVYKGSKLLKKKNRQSRPAYTLYKYGFAQYDGVRPSGSEKERNESGAYTYLRGCPA